MKYYIQDSNPLIEDEVQPGDVTYDQYGNLVEIDILGNPHILINTVLREDETIDSFEGYAGLKTFWVMSKKLREGYEIPNSTE